MYIGVDYYPEHWKRERWATDARLMREAGFNVVRLAEFAWGIMEPREGVFDFSLFDDALKLLAEHDIDVLMSTPTGVMPAWLARKYPECLMVKADGSRVNWGVRKNNCFTSRTYRLLSQRITTAMAEHFKDAPNVIGWQTDNEFDGNPCHCHLCRVNFQDWLQSKYGTIDAVNEAWGTHFWAHVVRSWSEIVIPDDVNSHNPGLCLDWLRFCSHLNVDFQREQVEILREVCPTHFVTHNTMSFHPRVDYRDLCADLDFASWDNYPVFGPPEIMYNAAAAADLVRGFKQKNYWVMEQTAGPGGWGTFGRNPWPGEIRTIAYQQFAHGCDGMVWFRWRTCTAGREQYWHGLLGHDGEPLRRYREAAQVAHEMKHIAPLMEGTTVQADVGIIYDYDSLWATNIQPSFENNQWLQNHFRRYYDALFRAGAAADFIPTRVDFSRYKLIIAPQLHVLPDAVALRLVDFVKQGGVLLTDLRTGVKTETNLCHERTLPGLLTEVLGVRIEEYGALSHPWGQGAVFTHPVVGRAIVEGSFTGTVYADWVTPTTAQVLAGYDEPWSMTAFAAATRNPFGKGVGFYVGTVIKEPEFYDAIVTAALRDAKAMPTQSPPPGVEFSLRSGNGRSLLFIINHTQESKSVSVPSGRRELITQTTTTDTLTLERWGVAVVQVS